ncbi:DUF4303 domain-containing protein [Anaerosporobacter faecicola]|uniref:DUF4303 domain-containing protein n=1 Tax=Anaerosporobacter faecicola TaxID=2718714 RepID=UPI00143912F6|nr:DUF4303 domain-containing protein [Anaerosporobacter faecicola]
MEIDLFQIKLVNAVEKAFVEVIQKNKGVYAFTLECASDLTSIGIAANTTKYLNLFSDEGEEDYCYFKYNEDEWEIFSGANQEFEELSKMLQREMELRSYEFFENDGITVRKEFHEFQKMIFDVGIEVMKQFSTHPIYQQYSYINLNFYVRDYYNEEEMIAIYASLNPKEHVIAEYRQAFVE